MNTTKPTDSTSQRSLIVNADDFGESQEINEGIVKTHSDGIVTSASLLTNMDGFEHALTCIQKNPTLDIGIHLNMHRGIPLTDARYLTKNHMFLRNIFRFTARVYSNPSRAREEITTEFEAQIQKALGHGVRISHLDTEKHLHTLPLVFSIVLTLAKKYNIPSVRLPYEKISLRMILNPAQAYKTAVMHFFAPRNKHLLKKSGLKSTNVFYGVSLSRRFTVLGLKNTLKGLRPGFTEISCHPGYTPKTNLGYIDAHREAELITLTDPALKQYVLKNGIVLSTFFDIR